MDNKQEYKPLATQWVINAYAIGLLFIFMGCVGTLLFFGYQQIMNDGQYSAESFGAINNIIVFLLGVVSGIVGSVIFGMEPTDVSAATKNSSERAKENFTLDAPVKTPNTDEL